MNFRSMGNISLNLMEEQLYHKHLKVKIVSKVFFVLCWFIRNIFKSITNRLKSDHNQSIRNTHVLLSLRIRIDHILDHKLSSSWFYSDTIETVRISFIIDSQVTRTLLSIRVFLIISNNCRVVLASSHILL